MFQTQDLRGPPSHVLILRTRTLPRSDLQHDEAEDHSSHLRLFGADVSNIVDCRCWYLHLDTAGSLQIRIGDTFRSQFMQNVVSSSVRFDYAGRQHPSTSRRALASTTMMRLFSRVAFQIGQGGDCVSDRWHQSMARHTTQHGCAHFARISLCSLV